MTTALQQLPTKLTSPKITRVADCHLVTPVKRCFLSRAEPPGIQRYSRLCRSSFPTPSPPLTYSRVSFFARRTWSRCASVDSACARSRPAAIMLQEAEDDIEIVYDARTDGPLGGAAQSGDSAGRQEQQSTKPRTETRMLAMDDLCVIQNRRMQPGLLGPAPGYIECRQVTRVAEVVDIPLRDYLGVGLIDTSREAYGASAEFRTYVNARVKMTEQRMLSWRKWDHTRLGNRLKASNPPNTVPMKLMCYNILAQQYITDFEYLYRNSPSPALAWEARSKLLLEEISFHSPDILCLQEVQESHFFGHLYQEFVKKGYTGVFKKKTGVKPDGSAVLFKSELFDLINFTAPEFQLNDVRLLDREQIGVIAQLVPKGKSEEDSFFVATTHLLYNPHRNDVRLAQLQVFFAELDRVAFCGIDPTVENLPRYKPIILCGDFNSLPYSPIYKFVTQGKLQFAGCRASTLTVEERGRILGDELIPAEVAITDNCQHAHIAAERLEWTGCPKEILKEYICDENSYSVRKKIGPSPSPSPSNGGKNCPKPATLPEDFWQRDFIPLSGSSSRETSRCRDGNTSSQSSPGGDSSSRSRESVEKNEEPVDRLRQPYGTGMLKHNFDFRSVYRHRFENLPQRPFEVTTFQDRWVTVDYIFYTTPYNPRSGKREENRLQLLSRYRCLTPHQCDLIGHLPTYGVPSDHLPIMARFLLHLKSGVTRRHSSL